MLTVSVNFRLLASFGSVKLFFVNSFTDEKSSLQQLFLLILLVIPNHAFYPFCKEHIYMELALKNKELLRNSPD